MPPLIIFSTTNHCNLQCQGCYHQALHQSPQLEMSDGKLESVIDEARDQLHVEVFQLGFEPQHVRTPA